MARLTIEGATKRFGRHAALDRVSMTVENGEFVAVLGPSGCGKTTLLRQVAGFETLDDGRISIGDRLVSAPGRHVPPEDRRMGIVFQSYALWPHMSVAENVAYALKVQGLPAADREARVVAALDTVGLSAFRDRRPAMLSGGQRQRVALARCLAMEPDLVLLDEPLANLDVHLRASMEDEFASFHKRTGTTMFYITHDQAEAMALANRIAVMDQGRLQQLATPSTLYREPANEMVARFIGSGMILPGRTLGMSGSARMMTEILGHPAEIRCAPGTPPDAPVLVCVRMEDLELRSPQAQGLPAHIRRLVYQGGHFEAELMLDAPDAASLRIRVPEPTVLTPGMAVRVGVRDGWIVPQATRAD